MNTLKESIAQIVHEEYQWLNESEQDDLVNKTMKRLAYRVARGYRTCSTCELKLQPIHFAQDRRSSDGLASRCKRCERARYRGRTSLPDPSNA